MRGRRWAPTAAQESVVRELWAANRSARAIGRVLGVDRNVIRHWAVTWGLPERDKRVVTDTELRAMYAEGRRKPAGRALRREGPPASPALPLAAIEAQQAAQRVRDEASAAALWSGRNTGPWSEAPAWLREHYVSEAVNRRTKPHPWGQRR